MWLQGHKMRYNAWKYGYDIWQRLYVMFFSNLNIFHVLTHNIWMFAPSEEERYKLIHCSKKQNIIKNIPRFLVFAQTLKFIAYTFVDIVKVKFPWTNTQTYHSEINSVIVCDISKCNNLLAVMLEFKYIYNCLCSTVMERPCPHALENNEGENTAEYIRLIYWFWSPRMGKTVILMTKTSAVDISENADLIC